MRAKFIPLAIAAASLACAPEAQPVRAPDTPAAVISQLYRDYAWEVVLQPVRSSRTLFDEPREVLVKYFDDSLTVVIERDRACMERTNEVCSVSGVPIWDSSDPQAHDLLVAAIDSVEVEVSFRRLHPLPDGEAVKLSYRMVMTARGWRVRDIVRHDGGSLVKTLSPMQDRPPGGA